MAGFQLQFCRQTSPVNSFFLLVWIRTPHRLTTTAVFRALVMVPSPTVGSQECSGKERNTCLKRLSHSSFLDKHHLGRGRWFSTPCLLLKAKAVPLATGEFRTLQRRFRIHLSTLTEKGKALVSISIPSISSVFNHHALLNCLYVDQKSDLLPPSDLRMTINSLENHSCFS